MEDGNGCEKIFPQVVTIWSSYQFSTSVLSAVYFFYRYYVPGWYKVKNKLPHTPFRGVSPQDKLPKLVHLTLANSSHLMTLMSTVLSPSKLGTRYLLLLLWFRYCMMGPLSTSSEGLSLGHRDMILQDTMILSLRQTILLTLMSKLPPTVWKSLSLINGAWPGVLMPPKMTAHSFVFELW